MVDQSMATGATIGVKAQRFRTSQPQRFLGRHGQETVKFTSGTSKVHRPEAIMRVGTFGANQLNFA